MTFGNAIDSMVARANQTWHRPSWWNLLVVLPWALGIALLIQEWRVDRRIAAHQQARSGVVTAHEPANHNRYGYKFEVDGKTFTGWQTPGKDDLAIGKTVIVFYDPQNPDRNSLTDFHDLSASFLGPVPMLLLGIGVVAFFISYRRRTTRESQPRL